MFDHAEPDVKVLDAVASIVCDNAEFILGVNRKQTSTNYDKLDQGTKEDYREVVYPIVDAFTIVISESKAAAWEAGFSLALAMEFTDDDNAYAVGSDGRKWHVLNPYVKLANI